MVTSICAGCQSAIVDKFLLTVLDKVWHVDCVRCVVCRVAMDAKCFARDGQLYCREDFFRHYGVKCSGCSRGISPEDLVRRTRNAVFHVRCFTCSACKKEPTTGEELFLLDDNNFICRDDYFAGKHHIAALSSADTVNNNNIVTSSSNNNNNRYDEDGSLMMMVSPPIEMTDETASASSPFSSIHPSPDSLHHLTCLSPVSTVDTFRLQQHSSSSSSNLHVMRTFPGNVKTRGFDVMHAHARSLLPVEADYPREVTSGVAKNLRGPEKGMRVKDGRTAVTTESALAGGQGLSKKRGPRTTIKAKQLETLKAAFLHSPKPTRHVREKLAAETSLSMRVIQVWFQNRRSKERRMRQLNVASSTTSMHHGGSSSMRRPPYYRTHRRLAGVSDAFRLASSSSLWATPDPVVHGASGGGGGGGGGRLMEARRDSHSRQQQQQQRPLVNYYEGGSGFLLSSGGGQHHHHRHHPTTASAAAAEDCIRILDNSCGSCSDNSPVNSSPPIAAVDDMKSFDAAGDLRSASAADSSPPPLHPHHPPPSSDDDDGLLRPLIRRSLPLIHPSVTAAAAAAAVSGSSRATRRPNGVTTMPPLAADSSVAGRRSNPPT